MDGDKETIFKEGIAKLCREYPIHSHFGGTRYFKEEDVYYLVFVKPVKYEKVALCLSDNKRHILEDGVHTLALRHYRIS